MGGGTVFDHMGSHGETNHTTAVVDKGNDDDNDDDKVENGERWDVIMR